MSKFDVKDKIDNSLYRIYNLISAVWFRLNPSAKKLLKKNLLYKNKHKGERCFILGTGPSLNTLTSSQVDALSREVVIGVNSLYKAGVVSSVSPKYYVLVDDLYRDQCSDTFSEVAATYKVSPPIFIADFRAVQLAEQANPSFQHMFIYAKKYPITDMSEQLDTNIFAAMNVISHSVLAAMYMGFSEIYLLGCDYNAFCAAGRGHAYDDTSETKEINYNLAFYLRFYWITTEFHYLIAKLAKRKSVTVINLTPSSLLDAYPRLPIDQVLSASP